MKSRPLIIRPTLDTHVAAGSAHVRYVTAGSTLRPRTSHLALRTSIPPGIQLGPCGRSNKQSVIGSLTNSPLQRRGSRPTICLKLLPVADIGTK